MEERELWNNGSLFGLPRSMGDAYMQAGVEGPNEPLFVWLN